MQFWELSATPEARKHADPPGPTSVIPSDSGLWHDPERRFKGNKTPECVSVESVRKHLKVKFGPKTAGFIDKYSHHVVISGQAVTTTYLAWSVNNRSIFTR